MFNYGEFFKLIEADEVHLETVQRGARVWMLENFDPLLMEADPRVALLIMQLAFRPCTTVPGDMLNVLVCSDSTQSLDKKLNLEILNKISSSQVSYNYNILILAFLLCSDSIRVGNDFSIIYYKNLLTIFSKPNPTIKLLHRPSLEFAVIKFQIQNNKFITGFKDFPNYKDDFIDMLIFELKSDIPKFMSTLMTKAYFFEIMAIKIMAANEKETRAISVVLKKNLYVLSELNKSSFRHIIMLLPIDEVIAFAEEFKNDPKIQMKILKNIETNNLSSIGNKDTSKLYLRLLCQLRSPKIIEVLRNDAKLNINEKMEICRETNNKRGEAYCLKKISSFDRSRQVYFEILRDYFQFSKTEFDENEVKEVLEITEEMIDPSNNDETIVTLKNIIVLITFNCGSSKFKRIFLEKIFVMLFNFTATGVSVLSEFKKLNEYKMLISSRQFTENLNSNFKTIISINEKILILAETQISETNMKILKSLRSGMFIISQPCFFCKSFLNETAGEFMIHKCGAMVHDNCQIQFKNFRCISCEKLEIGLDLKNEAKNTNKEKSFEVQFERNFLNHRRLSRPFHDNYLFDNFNKLAFFDKNTKNSKLMETSRFKMAVKKPQRGLSKYKEDIMRNYFDV